MSVLPPPRPEGDQTKQYHRVKAAAERIRANMLDAKRGGYYRDAWYAYQYKVDVEVLVENILGPYPEDQRGDRI